MDTKGFIMVMPINIYDTKTEYLLSNKLQLQIKETRKYKLISILLIDIIIIDILVRIYNG